MGAVVGGLYASGYNAHQLDSIFKATNFDELIKGLINKMGKLHKLLLKFGSK